MESYLLFLVCQWLGICDVYIMRAGVLDCCHSLGIDISLFANAVNFSNLTSTPHGRSNSRVRVCADIFNAVSSPPLLFLF